MPNILAVDDEIKNLKLIERYLSDTRHNVIFANGGPTGLDVLEAQHKDIDLILLDRMMPEIDGMEFISRICKKDYFRNIPIIMQTAAAQPEQVTEGIKAGVYYYLTKPFDQDMLVTLVDSAIEEYKHINKLQEEALKHKQALDMVSTCDFNINRLKDTEKLSVHISSYYPDPQKVILGISELITNALEHGNANITYEEKTELHAQHKWAKEVERRLELPENKDKQVKVHYEKNDKEILLTIEDEGKGFEWKDFLEVHSDRMGDTHGRGIAIANLVCFDNLEYIGCGNKVVARVFL